MPTQVEIINQALRHLGAQEIQDVGENRPEATRAARAWPNAVDYLLRKHAWNFAQQWMKLAASSSAPVIGYACAYTLPVECVRLIDVRAEGDLSHQQARHELVGRTVYTDASPCYARMVVAQSSPVNWPPDFCRALGYLLAADLAPSIVRDEGTKIKMFSDLFAMAFDDATLADATESAPVEAAGDGPGSYIAARR